MLLCYLPSNTHYRSNGSLTVFVRFLLQMLTYSTTHGAKHEIPFEDKIMINMHSDTLNEKRHLLIWSLNKRIKHIEHANKYAQGQDVSWCEAFFHYKHKVIKYCLHLTWSFGMHNPISCSNWIPDYLKKLVHLQQRCIY